MKLWAFVFIALFAAVFFLGATSSLVCGRGGAPRRRREAVLQLAVGEPSAREQGQSMQCVRGSASERRIKKYAVCAARKMVAPALFGNYFLVRASGLKTLAKQAKN